MDFGRARIPYRVIGRRKFQESVEIKDVAAWLRLCVNRDDTLACERILYRRRTGFGERSMERVRRWADESRIPIGEALYECAQGGVLKGGARSTAQEVSDALHELGGRMNRGEGPGAILEHVVEVSGVGEAALKRSQVSARDEAARGRAQLERLAELARIAAECPTVVELNDHLAVSDLPPGATDEDRVTISTVHGCKGAEYDHVLLMGLNEEVLPSSGVDAEDATDGGGIEEERRILHVAATRARRTLTMTWARERAEVDATPSRFIEEIGRTVTEIDHEQEQGWRRADGAGGG